MAAPLALLLSLALAACSSSTSSSPGTSGSTSPSSSVPSAQSASPSAGLASARAVVAKYEQPATSVGIETGLNAAPAAGKTLVYLQCELAQCAGIEQLIAGAVSAVGWNIKVLPFQTANPATFTSALNTALQYHPVAVTFLGVDPYAVWSSSVAAYKAAGVAMIPLGSMDAPTNATIIRNVVGRADIELQARVLADWFISDSDGHGNAVFWTVPQLSAIDATQKAFSAEVTANCPGCTVKILQQALPDVAAGMAPATIVSTLRADPSAKYIFLGNIVEAAGLTSALKAAGLAGIKVAGFDAGATDQKAVEQGTEAAVIPFPLTISAWQVVDAALRFSEGMTIPAEPATFQLLTRSTMASSDVQPSDAYPYPADYQSLFKQLWKVS